MHTLSGSTANSISSRVVTKGQEFESFALFKNAVYDWAVADSFSVRVSKSDQQRVVFLCHHRGCKFKVAAWWRSALGKVSLVPGAI